MPMTFPSAVAVPPTSSYAAPLMDFQDFGNLTNKFYEGVNNEQRRGLNDQARQLNEQRIQQGQMAVDASRAVASGDFRTKDGGIDYSKLVQTMLRFGDVNGLQQLAPLMQTQMAAGTPLYGEAPKGSGAPTASQPTSGAPANSPKGDQPGSIMSRVTDALPAGSDKVGVVAGNIARSLGVDPNGTLSPEIAAEADKRIKAYAQRNGNSASASPTSRVDGGFSALPPSANAVAPAPPSTSAAQPEATPQQQPAPTGAASQGQGQPAQGLPMPDNPYTGKPIGSREEANNVIKALNTRIAQFSGNPALRDKAAILTHQRDQIEQAIKPLHIGSRMIDPVTGAPAYRGDEPTMSPQAVQDAAERYIETGQFPPNMSRGTQGTADRNAILDAAHGLAVQRGINTAELPQKWREFKITGDQIKAFNNKNGNTVRSFNVLVDHLDTLSEAATALGNSNNRLFNRVAQSWAANTGGTAPTNFDGVKALVGDEIVKAVVGSAGALADREEVKKDLDRASSPKQLEELVGKYKKLALGQLHGLEKQYEFQTKQKNFRDALLPGTLTALGGKEGKAEGGKPKPDANGVVTYPEGTIREIK